MAGGEAQIHPAGLLPGLSQGPLADQRSNCPNLEEHRCTMSGRIPDQGLRKNQHPVWAPPRAVPVSRHETHHKSHQNQLSRSPFRLRELLPRGGTYYGVQGKNSLKLHRTYYEIFSKGTKGMAREGFR